MLDVRGLRAGDGDTPPLHGIDLHVASGEVVALLGPAGAGKTTLARALSGLVPTQAGRLLLDDRDLTGADAVAVVRAGLIHVPEGGCVFGELSVRDNLLLGATLRGRLQRQATLRVVLGLLPRLGAVLGRRAGGLDEEARQMLAIGRGLMGLPRLLILDRPSLGLSPDRLGKLLAAMAYGPAILLLERDPAGALPFVHRAYAIDRGRVSRYGPPYVTGDI